jgi:hypothetical protein
MNKTALISMAVSLGLASFSVNAANRHAVSSYMDLEVACTCDWSTDPGTCTVSWNDVSARDYMADIRFDAKSSSGDQSLLTEAILKLSDSLACDPVTGMCSASGEFAMPDSYPPDAAVTFEARVKGVGSGPDGVTPRNFTRNKGACNLPVDEPEEPAFDPNLY